MQQKVSPLAALLIVVGIVVVMGAFFALRSRQDGRDAQETARRGAAVGERMMQSMKGR